MKGSVVITGASSGIGEACAIYLDKLGYQVFAGVRREADAEALKCKALKKTIPIILDVTDEASIKTAVKMVQLSLGSHGLTGLVNNAGIVSTGPLEFLPISELRKQLEVNVIGQIAVTQAFLPLLRKSSTGRIINMGSDSGKVCSPLLGPYCASKFALEALTDVLRMELQPWEINVSIIEPGAVTTPIWGKSIEQVDKIWESFPDQAKKLYLPTLEAVRKTANKIGQKGISAEEVAKVVSQALAVKRPKARYVVGMDAKINILLAKIMPERVLDKLISLYLGLPKNAERQNSST
ncbi:short-chain dehydrogenase/reductase [Nostoc sp. ATCC 43529]|nr:short-chain dehydrogenase/reductase [Nostoc sp. ATCC 43529]